MTTYILHGGLTSKESPLNNDFFKTITLHVNKETVFILLCFFARQRQVWEKLEKEISEKVRRFTSKNVVCSVAEDPADLIKKMPEFDVLYVAGGDEPPIEVTYSKLIGLKELLINKVYVGSSMGAFMASRYYVTSSSGVGDAHVSNGIGLLPVSTLCHYDVEQNKELKLSLLREIDPSLPIIALDECKFVTLLI